MMARGSLWTRALLCATCGLLACRPNIVVDELPETTLAAAGAGNPTAALDPASGHVYVAWTETRDATTDVFVTRMAGSRSAAVRVNDIAGDAAPHEQAPPQVEVGHDGAVYVAWQNNILVPGRRFPASNLRFARSSDGGRTFSPAINVNDDAGGPPASHTFHDIAVAPDGTIFVAWIDGRERAQVETAHSGHGAGMPGSDVRVATSTDGGRTFSPGVVVYHDVCPCCRTALAVGSNGAVAVALRSAAQNTRDIVVVRSSDGGATFGEPVRVHVDNWQVDACPHAGASMTFGSDGRLHVAWYTGAEARQGLWYARSTPDLTAFEQPVALQTGGWVPVSQVKLAADAAGDVWITWDDRRGEQPVWQSAIARAGKVSRLALQAPGQSPALAAHDRVVIAWQHEDRALARVLRRR